MFNIIERFMEKLSIDQVRDFSFKNGVDLSEEELSFTYSFIKKNWSQLLNNPNMLELDKYQDKFSPENFTKIKRLINEYLMKYKNYL